MTRCAAFLVGVAVALGCGPQAESDLSTAEFELKPPPGPTQFRVTSSSQTSISTAWEVTPRTRGWYLYRNGVRVADRPAANGAVFTFSGLSCGTSHQLGVEAYNHGGISPRTSLQASTAPCGAAPACSDGTDNDGDGATDFPADPGCSSATDTDETNAAPPPPPPPPPPTGLVCDSPNTLAAPPATWQEHWFEHVQLLNRVYYNDGVAVYFDNDMNLSTASWLFDFVCRMRIHVARAYGDIRTNRLFAIFHQNKYGGGHPASYYSSSHDFRNVVDQGLSSGWVMTNSDAKDIPAHEIAHIIEFTIHGKKGSPAFDVWKDSKWAEFFQYDVYKALGWDAEAQRVYNRWVAKSEAFPRTGTYWFRDWFFPLWRDHGGAAVMRRFFELSGQYWAADSGGNLRQMTLGDFVHFTSGAARANLKGMATAAFGWTSTTEAQFQASRTTYSQVTALYPP